MTLQEIQKNLKAPKNQLNKFGGYNYRSCEDILEAVKPLLGNSLLTLTDDILSVGNRVYVKATATFNDGVNIFTVNAYAREAETKKGMDESQITGSASSYARKYALNGLFLIDDEKDVDTRDNRTDEIKKDALADSIARLEEWLYASPCPFDYEQAAWALKAIKEKNAKNINLALEKAKELAKKREAKHNANN